MVYSVFSAGGAAVSDLSNSASISASKEKGSASFGYLLLCQQMKITKLPFHRNSISVHKELEQLKLVVFKNLFKIPFDIPWKDAL